MTSKNTASEDDRFSKVKKDPRFWEMPDKERKVKIDKRFQSMFHDKRFKLKYTVDKRGRPVNHSSAEDLKRFYNLSDSDQSDEDEEMTVKTKKKEQAAKKIAGKQAQADEEDNETDESEEEEEEDIQKNPQRSSRSFVLTDEDEESGVDDDVTMEKGSSEASKDDDDDDDDDDDESGSEEDGDSGPDLARGRGNIETSSDEDDDDDDVEDLLHQEEEEIEHDWGEMWKDAPRTDNTSRRLAVCNMDWDRIKAKDLLALFNSFMPKGGMIFPSEFGKERMKMEQTQGPMELNSLPDNPDADTEEQRNYREKVRDYQFKRLKYYYAVVECDTVETAAKIYEECDGFEYESSCSTIDLRFIPDDVIFDDEEPKDSATDVDYASYRPKLFTSTATTTAKVGLTWDETDHDRITALCRKFNKDEMLDMDFSAYLASSSEEDDEEPEKQVLPAKKPVESLPEEKKLSKGRKDSDQINKYRELLKSIQDKEKKKDDNMDMEITWVPGLKEKTEMLVKKKMDGKDQLTPWEEFLEKKREKKKEKRKGMKAEEEEPIISDDEIPDDVDLNDPFFTEELSARQSLKKKKKSSKEEERTAEEEDEMKKQRAEMELLMADDEDDGHKHFNYDQIVEHQNLSKNKRKKLLKSSTPLNVDDFQVDVKDPRFQAMFTSHLYNLDPSDPAYKKTKGTQSILEEKLKRREEEQKSQEVALKSKEAQGVRTEAAGAEDTSAAKGTDPNLSLLIKSVKNKTEQFQARKKQKTK
ncbi:ESF1 -like protein ABT1-associated protein [Triplophysa tibetana]|uniref:ESF1-like protein ABT1-associated protein n=1 Tax=Triplophysa tibetana TaxID=1572043 RepID=A0A5A9PIU8_9TELE|nr:ESF1 -like protein ABT1-associated protein [Triplophysa tibetana]